MSNKPSDIKLSVLTPESCDDCGFCCQGIGSPVVWYTSFYETSQGHSFRPAGIPQELIAEIEAAFGGLMRGQEPEACCLWFDTETRRCRHYEWRPQVCIDYELGGTACLASRRPHLAGGGVPVAESSMPQRSTEPSSPTVASGTQPQAPPSQIHPT